MSRMVIACPQCGSPARIRHSEAMTEHIRLQIFQCKRLGCGCQWKVLAETVAIIAASALPGARRTLPYLSAADCTGLFLNDERDRQIGVDLAYFVSGFLAKNSRLFQHFE